jgi:uncharacterized protein YheU (UPF0270 family)
MNAACGFADRAAQIREAASDSFFYCDVFAMIVPPEELSPDTLRALVEEFVTRHGAVQGHAEVPIDTMISQVLSQIRTGKAFIVFDEKDETCSVVTKQELSRPSEERVHSRDAEDAEELQREITTDYTDEHGWEDQDECPPL